jgi:hypothetical protein
VAGTHHQGSFDRGSTVQDDTDTSLIKSPPVVCFNLCPLSIGTIFGASPSPWPY